MSPNPAAALALRPVRRRPSRRSARSARGRTTRRPAWCRRARPGRRCSTSAGRAALAPAAAVVLGDGGLEDLRAVGPGDPVLGAADRKLPAHFGFHRHRLDAELQRLAVQRAADATGEPGPVQKDAGALVLSRPQVGLSSYRPSPDSPCGRALVAELPVGRRSAGDGVVEVAGRRRRTGTRREQQPSSGRSRDGALAGRVPNTHVQRDSSQVRSAAIRCSGLSGS